VMRRGALPSIVEPPLFLSPDNTTRRSKYAGRWFPGVIQVAVTLTSLIYPANSFWSVGRPQLIRCCGSVPMDHTLLRSTRLYSRTVLSRYTDAGAAGGC